MTRDKLCLEYSFGEWFTLPTTNMSLADRAAWLLKNINVEHCSQNINVYQCFETLFDFLLHIYVYIQKQIIRLELYCVIFYQFNINKIIGLLYRFWNNICLRATFKVS